MIGIIARGRMNVRIARNAYDLRGERGGDRGNPQYETEKDNVPLMLHVQKAPQLRKFKFPDD